MARHQRRRRSQQPKIHDARVANLIGRRQFLRTASGLFVAGVGASCGTTDVNGSGIVHVTITGLQAGFTSAGVATITGSGISEPIVIELPAVSEGQAPVPVGTYNVVYAPPSGYQIAPGTTNEVEVAVTVGETTEVTFTVVVVNEETGGTLRITVTGLVGASSGGSAEVLRTDVAGSTPITVAIPVAGTIDTDLIAGAYTVTYSAPTNHQLSSGETNPQNVDITAGATITVTYQVEQLPAPPPVIFNSDWSTALGTSDAALRDTGKSAPWNIAGGEGIEVIASTGLDFPTANVLRVTALLSTSGFGTVRKTGMLVPAVGQSRYYRWYIRMGPNIEDANVHPIQDGQNAGASNWQFESLNTIGGANRWTVQFKMGAVGGNAFNQNWRGPVLDCDVTYRFELHLQRFGTISYNFHVRVYTSASATPVFTDQHFLNIDASGSPVDHLGQQPDGHFTFLNVANLDGLNAGCNGIAPLSSNRVYSWQAAFAVGTVDWIGPYSGGI